MNAAYARAWADISGEQSGVLPYEALGFVTAARQLLEALSGMTIEVAASSATKPPDLPPPATSVHQTGH
jgi:hypothetical protein